MKQLTWYELYLGKIIQTTKKTSGVGISISGIETCNHKQEIDKDQIFLVEELRSATLELGKKNPQSSGIKIAKIRYASFYLIHTIGQNSGIKILEFRNFKLNKMHQPHTQ